MFVPTKWLRDHNSIYQRLRSKYQKAEALEAFIEESGLGCLSYAPGAQKLMIQDMWKGNSAALAAVAEYMTEQLAAKRSSGELDEN